MKEKIEKNLLFLLKQKETEEKFIPLVTKLRDELGLKDRGVPPLLEILGGQIVCEGLFQLAVGMSKYSCRLQVSGSFENKLPEKSEKEKVDKCRLPLIARAIALTLEQESWQTMSTVGCQEGQFLFYACKDGLKVFAVF